MSVASFRAIQAVSDALVSLLRSSYDRDDFDDIDLGFEVYAAADFESPMAAGVSVYLYRARPNGAWRIPPGRLDADGRRQRHQIPVDLSYLLSVWGRDASIQHRLLGWLMRTMEDTPVLPHGLLDTVAPGTFHPDEAVEVVLNNDLSNEDLFRLWETATTERFRLSVPYIARTVLIESRLSDVEGAPVEERVLTFDSQVQDA